MQLARAPVANAACRNGAARRGQLVVVANMKKPTTGKILDSQGVIAKDNSGRTNIFPVANKAYYSSPTTDAVASSGLGGEQGVGLLAAALALVGAITVGVALSPDSGVESLTAINDAFQGDSLSAVAARLSASL